MGFLNQVKIKLLNDNARIPVKSTEHSAGFDIFSSEDTVLEKRTHKLISTGVTIQMPLDMEAQIRPRSGLAAKNGITVLNSPGTIDADYRGEIKIILINHSDIDFNIKIGDRLAQMVFSRVMDISFEEVADLSETKRGEGGFGSTGVNS